MAQQQVEEDAIEALIKSYETALNAGDTDAIMDLLGASPVYLIQNAPATVGRDPVRKQTEQTFKTVKFAVRFAVHEVETRGDLAWARSSHAKGNQLWIFHLENGKWKVHRYMAAANSPA